MSFLLACKFSLILRMLPANEKCIMGSCRVTDVTANTTSASRQLLLLSRTSHDYPATYILLREMGLFNLLLQSAILCLLLIKFSLGSLHFLRARPRGGMLQAPSTPSNVNVKDLPEAQWFTQRLDHFDDSNIKTWQQRYFCNDGFHVKPDGPSFSDDRRRRSS